MDDYEYELLNMSFEEMDEIANGSPEGKGDNESKNPDLRPGSNPESGVDVRVVPDERVAG